jgi:hypothetical protein
VRLNSGSGDPETQEANVRTAQQAHIASWMHRSPCMVIFRHQENSLFSKFQKHASCTSNLAAHTALSWSFEAWVRLPPCFLEMLVLFLQPRWITKWAQTQSNHPKKRLTWCRETETPPVASSNTPHQQSVQLTKCRSKKHVSTARTSSRSCLWRLAWERSWAIYSNPMRAPKMIERYTRLSHNPQWGADLLVCWVVKA